MGTVVERCSLASDLSISRVINGLWQVADMERGGEQLDLEESAEAMKLYVDAGFTTFDMADHYGSAELISGRFLERHAAVDSVQLLTKWVPEPGRSSREGVRAAVQRSLERMKSDRLDLLQFHAWHYPDPGWLDCLFWLQELREEGLIRHLGVTNFDGPHLSMVVHSGIEVVSNQVCFSLLDQRALDGMTELCLRHGIRILAFGVLAGGFLCERWVNQPAPEVEDLQTWSQMKYWRFIQAAGGWDRFQEVLRIVRAVAGRFQVSIANVASRYILDQPAVGGIILGTRLGRSRHVEENLRLFQFELDEASRLQIRQALAGLDPIPGGCGDEYRKTPFLTASGDLSHHFRELPAPYGSRKGPDGRHVVLSGTPWEDLAGYCRAVRKGNSVWVSGTTATHGDRLIGGDDPASQTHFVIDKIEGALQSVGARLEDVVRTRVFIRDLDDWEAVARAHGERFRAIRPANTLVQAGLIGTNYRVEIEAEARLAGDSPEPSD